ncbi:MAG: thiol:disulfide interchange protein DsbA/DsbL [Gammaproteobacteria bacterium]|nr:thiol:disulfide interchange protein DsbA/DsbL [Gammaproteobacteria bacterium]
MRSVWLKRFFMVVMLAPLSLMAKNYDEGIEYTKLDKPQATQSADKVEVTEFFWYGCPHCFQFEPTLGDWLARKPDNVRFVRIPLPLNPSWLPHTKTYYALELMGKGEQYHHALFKAMHVDKIKLYTQSALTDFLVKQGVDKKAFEDAVGSFAVEMRARQAMQMVKAYGLNGVPAMAVNGKYTTSASQAGSYKGMIDIVNHLVKQETK